MKKSVVIFSGGQDSTTCLGWALKKFEKVIALSFYYGQNHDVEIRQAEIICEKLDVEHHIIKADFFGDLVESALTHRGDVNAQHSAQKHLPASFVPNRNQFFITLAHAFAQKVGASSLVTGVCETDYSGYPDCRAVFIDAVEKASNLGSDTDIKIHTPLMKLNKAETFKMAADYGVLDIVIKESHTCYNGVRDKMHEWGAGCDDCPACTLRKKGFGEYKKMLA
jgi:7-cyano-7-deazaguanine synthase